ncbi:MAG TPA: zinc ribbon domain-containing protein [Gemmatimonadaceae bacterium]|jgi:putative FmdB family regulatory protein|nr:zinc ribbon domain-containing protein [Gemmatimonadaceae bacterium]
MPTYEFRCPDGHEFEKFYRKISDYTSELPCPVCGKPATRLVSGGAGLLFKGSGFYLTDYGKNAHRKAAPTSDSGDGKGSGDTKGGDTKAGDTASTPSESKGSDTKSTESKPSESKATSEAKPAKKPSSGTPKSGT